MSTKYPDLFAALAEPFPAEEVKQRTAPGGKKQLHYITARTAMNRLDTVLGPENWWDEFTPMENSVVCKLSIRLPDGQVLTKADAGGYAGMADSGDDDKSGYSDAFKRAAAKFGVARYLYRDGIPRYAPAREPEASAPSRKAPRPWDEILDRAIGRWHRFDPIADGKERTAREHRIAQHLASAAIADELLAEASICGPAEAGKPPARDRAKVWAAVKRLHAERPDWTVRALKLYLEEKAAEADAVVPQPSAN